MGFNEPRPRPRNFKIYILKYATLQALQVALYTHLAFQQSATIHQRLRSLRLR